MLPEYKNKLSVFLGSGASAFAGYRTFSNFFEMILDHDTREREKLPSLHPETPGLVEEIKSFLATIDREPTHDNILWILNDYKTFCSNITKNYRLRNRFEDRMRGQISALEVLVDEAVDDITRLSINHYLRDCVKWCKQHDGQTLLNMKEVVSFYNVLAENNSPNTPHLSIFTTNYDLLLEDLFIHGVVGHDQVLVTGFGMNPPDGRPWNPDEFQRCGTKGFHIYRLHGCSAWFYTGFRDRNIYFYRQDALQQDWKNNACVMFPGREIWRGNLPHALGFRAFYNSILSSKAILFIGFSFRDHDVVQLLMVANLHRQNDIKLAIINPVVTLDYLKIHFADAASKCIFPYSQPDYSKIKLFPVRFGTKDTDHKKLALDIISWIEEEANDQDD